MKFSHIRMALPEHLGGKFLDLQMPWFGGISEDDVAFMAASLEGFNPPMLTAEEKEAQQKKEAEKLAAQRESIEKRRFQKAQKITLAEANSEWFYSESYPYADGYFDDVEYLKECVDPDEEITYIWPCKKIKPEYSTAEELVDVIFEDFEDYEIPASAILELQQALDKFKAATEHVGSYTPDYSRVILLTEVRHESP